MTTHGPGAPARPSGGRLAEGSAGLLIRNTLVSAAGTVGGVAVTLLLTPFMIHRLGADAYGVWILALTLSVAAGYLSLTDLGAQQAAVRFIADARREGDRDRENGVYSTTFALFLGLALALVPMLVLVAPLLTRVFSIEGEIQDDAAFAFQLIGAQLVFDLPGLAFRAMLEGAQRFVVLRAIDLFRVLLQATMIVVVLLAGHGLVLLAASSLVAAAASSAAMGVATHWKEPSIHLRLSLVDREQLRRLMSLGGALFVLRITSVLYRQMDRVIIAVVLGVALVTSYEIANKIQGAVVVVLSISSAALLPAATFLHADRERLRELYLRGTSYTVAITVPVAVAAMIYAEPIVVGWVGEGFSASAGLTRLFLVWLIASALDMVGWSILVSLGYLRAIVWLNVVWVLTNLALSLVLVHPLGVAGVVLATVTSYAGLSVAYTWLFLRKLDVRLSDWVRRVVSPNLPGVATQIAFGVLLIPLTGGLPDLAAAAIGCSVMISSSIAMYLFVGITSSERSHLVGALGTALGRRPSPPPAIEAPTSPE